jgi:transcriptional regulator with XRE-family HTH domain
MLLIHFTKGNDRSMEKIGTKLKLERKKLGLSLRDLAQKVGISPMTLHRIEIGKSSPSVVLLAEIANYLNKPIVSFLEEPGKPKLPIHIRQKNQLSISTPMLKIKVIGPRKMIADNIVVTAGELGKGKTTDLHTNQGREFTYIIEGECKFAQGGQTLLLKTGDSILHNARLDHSVTATERLRCFSIFIKEKD